MRVEKRTLGIYWIQPPLNKSGIKIQWLKEIDRERGDLKLVGRKINMKERSYKKKKKKRKKQEVLIGFSHL